MSILISLNTFPGGFNLDYVRDENGDDFSIKVKPHHDAFGYKTSH